MKSNLLGLTITVSALLTGLGAAPAHADGPTAFEPFTVSRDAPAPWYGSELVLDARNGTRLNFGKSFLGFLNATGTRTSGIGGAALGITRISPTSPLIKGLTADLPVDSVTLSVDTMLGSEWASVVHRFSLGGGLQFRTLADDFTSSGGALSITNLNIDLSNWGIYADMEGANGVGRRDDVLIWRFNSVEGGGPQIRPGCLASIPECRPSVGIANTIRGMRITDEAYTVVTQSLGLTAAGEAALQAVGNYGTFVTSVPEPSSWAMVVMGVAVAGLSLNRRRRATTH